MSWQMLANLHHFKWQMKEITVGVGKAVSRTLLSMHLFTHKPLFHRKPGLNSSVRKLSQQNVIFIIHFFTSYHRGQSLVPSYSVLSAILCHTQRNSFPFLVICQQKGSPSEQDDQRTNTRRCISFLLTSGIIFLPSLTWCTFSLG